MSLSSCAGALNASRMESDGLEITITRAIDNLEESGYRGKIRIAFDEWNLRGRHHPGFPRKEVQGYDDSEVSRLVAARDENLIPFLTPVEFPDRVTPNEKKIELYDGAINLPPHSLTSRHSVNHLRRL